MKSTKITDLRGRDNGELERQIAENNARLMALNFQKVTGHLDNSAQIQTLRRDNARIKTVLSERKQATK